MNKLKGTVISPGIAAGKIVTQKAGKTPKKPENKFLGIEEEISRLKYAVHISRKEIADLKEKALEKVSKKEAEIFDAHLMFLEDPMLIDDTYSLIKEKKIKAEEALHNKLEELSIIFTQIEDPLFKSRGTDLKDVGNRLINTLTKKETLSYVNEKTILLAEEINPSEILSISEYIPGIIVENGSQNAHSSILARALKIPVILIDRAFHILKEGENIILDCNSGYIIQSPDEKTRNSYKNKLKEINTCQKKRKKQKAEETFTKDGIKITLLANIVHPKEAEEVIASGAEGVGIYRTEFSYLGKLPSEEELFQDYKSIGEALNPLPVNIRTLDLGADKWPPYLPPLKEENPALGLRGIRFSLKNKEIFITQLKAILRASLYGNIQIILPMVSIIEDIIETKKLIKKISEELGLEKKVPLGIMLETPSSVLCCEDFAKEADFMSMGTNDLVQYTMAADREFDETKEWYQSSHPSMIKLYSMAALAGEKNNIPVSICGEIGGDKKIVPLLIGCGIKGFSMAPSGIKEIREDIKKRNYNDLKNLSQKT